METKGDKMVNGISFGIAVFNFVAGVFALVVSGILAKDKNLGWMIGLLLLALINFGLMIFNFYLAFK